MREELIRAVKAEISSAGRQIDRERSDSSQSSKDVLFFFISYFVFFVFLFILWGGSRPIVGRAPAALF